MSGTRVVRPFEPTAAEALRYEKQPAWIEFEQRL